MKRLPLWILALLLVVFSAGCSTWLQERLTDIGDVVLGRDAVERITVRVDEVRDALGNLTTTIAEEVTQADLRDRLQAIVAGQLDGSI